MESKRDYLRRILEMNRDDVGYCDMDTCMKEYNRFMKELNLSSKRGGEEEKLFIEFNKSQTTVSNYVKKKKGKEVLFGELKGVLDRAFDYYETILFPIYYDQAVKMSPKNADIELNDKARINSIISPLDDVDKFISELDEKWSAFNDYLYRTIDLVLSGNYDGENALPTSRNGELDNVVNEEISFINNRIVTYKKSFDDTEGIYYTGKNDNPYKNLYIYCLMSYIKNFYVEDIPNLEEGHFYELNIFSEVEEKEKYSLMDVAEAYSQMSGVSCDKAYGKIKQQFRKSEFMQAHKVGREYEFDDLVLPLATYVYYSRKNHTEPKYEKPFVTYDRMMVHVYAPFLRALIHHESMKITAMIKYCDFIKAEFDRALQRVDDAYMNMALELIIESPMRLYYRCTGMDVNSILG